MSSSSRSVLVIEDDRDLRELYVARLQGLGYSVRTAGTGGAGLDAALADPPELVILDLVLPDMDGWEVARRLRANANTAAVPVLVASILEDDEDEEVEISGYLVKPFGARELRTIVTRIAGPAAAEPDLGADLEREG